MRNTRRAAVVIAAAFLFCYSAAAPAQGVMDQVPADALAVLKVNRLEQTNKKAAKWTEALGLAQLSPEAANPLQAIQEKLNIREGLDTSGDMAVVFLDPDKAGGAAAARRPAAGADGDDENEGDDNGAGGADKGVLILVPVKDYKAFVGQLPNANAKGAITSFRPEDANEDVFVANWGNYAAMSPSQAVLQNKPQAGMKVTGLAARELKEKDVVLYANIPAIKAKALPRLQELRQQMKQQLEAGNAQAPRTAPGRGNRSATGGARRPARPADADEADPDQQQEQQENLQISFQQGQGQGATQQRQRPAPARQAQPVEAEQDAQAADDAAGDAEQAQNRTGQRQRAGQGQGGARRGQGAARRGAGANADGQNQAAAMSAMMDQYFGIAERFLNEGQAATVGWALGDQGISSTALAEFQPNTYMAKIAQGLKNTDQNLMTGLPDRKYFAFGGLTVSPQVMSQLVTDMMKPMLEQMQGAAGQGGQGQPTTEEVMNAAKQFVENAKSMSFGYTVPTGALGADSIIQAVTVINGNAKAIAEAEKKLVANTATSLKSMLGATGGDVSFELNQGAKTVGGVKLDQYRFNIEMDADNPQAQQVQQFMGMFFGPNGLSGTMGAVDDNTFLMVQGGSDKLVADAVAAAKGKQDPISKMQLVQTVRKQLPQQRVGEAYVALDQIIKSAVQYAQGFGLPVRMQLPNNLPPIGVSVASEGTALRVDSHVPTNLIQSVVAAGMQAYMQMQGGGAGAPDGL